MANIAKTHASFRGTTAYRMLLGIFASIVLVQCIYLVKIGPGVGKLCDGFSEANAFRAADAYLKDGITSYHGLPRQAYGNRFYGQGCLPGCLDENGAIKLEARRCLPANYADPNQWVYMHYPEGPDVLLALMGHIATLDHVRVLRLFPLSLCLFATAVLFLTLARAFGADCAALIAAACAVLPMFHTYMPGLHFQGYSLALFLFQLSLLIRMVWLQTRAAMWNWVALFGLGFLQGWLSFDQCFVVGLVALPLWLMRKSEGASPDKFWLALSIILPLAGFGLAHILHFLQVAGETGSIGAALLEFRNTAAERGGQTPMATNPLPQMFQRHFFAVLLQHTEGCRYLRSLLLAVYQYIRDFINPGCVQFSPVLPLAVLFLFPVILFRSVQLVVLRKTGSSPVRLTFCWPELRSVMPSLWAAMFVSSLWLLIMPGHALGNHHITVRHFFVFYFFAVLTIARSIRIDWPDPSNDKPENS